MKKHWRIIRGDHGYTACEPQLRRTTHIPARWAETKSVITCSRCRQQVGVTYSCYCDENCGPHHRADTDWCPNPPTRVHLPSGSRFCQACADARQIPTKKMKS